MKKNVEVEIDISGADMAKELWRFDAVEQMSFYLNSLEYIGLTYPIF